GVQWMTAGSGIVHEEMPEQENGLLRGLQLWVNLPSSLKMMPPRYQDISPAQIPESVTGDGVRVRAIAGHVENITGPIVDIIVSPVLFDFTLPQQATYVLPVSSAHTVFAYVLQGAVAFGEKGAKQTPSGHVVLLGDGDTVKARAGGDGGRFILAAGEPIREPIAWRGPVVMNTEDEVTRAFDEYRKGTFVKARGAGMRVGR
ncbi:MAG: pirin family protein, partial [Chitinivibrionales bacterium]|nr:pirin family protein [Chitinivibrionales bacterium]